MYSYNREENKSEIIERLKENHVISPSMKLSERAVEKLKFILTSEGVVDSFIVFCHQNKGKFDYVLDSFRGAIRKANNISMDEIKFKSLLNHNKHSQLHSELEMLYVQHISAEAFKNTIMCKNIKGILDYQKKYPDRSLEMALAFIK
jgi:hypothetical protein